MTRSSAWVAMSSARTASAATSSPAACVRGGSSYNGANTNSFTPMGGYKQSGIGRSMGVFGLEEYLEVKSIFGFEEEAHALPLHV